MPAPKAKEATTRAGRGVKIPVLRSAPADRPIRGLPVQEVLPAHVVSHASGGRDLWSEPLDAAPDDLEAGVRACLDEVLDPEIPISLIELGLIYGVEVRRGSQIGSAGVDPEAALREIEGGAPTAADRADDALPRVTVQLSFTATACPCMEFIKEDVRDRLEAEPWLGLVEIEEVWDPPWTTDRITPEGRRKLRELGVGS